MSWIEAIILGIIQGLTEFLPVSSSGHLEIGKVLLDIKQQNNLTFTVVVHGATVLSTIVVFRKDIAKLFKGIFAFNWNDETKYMFKIIVSMIPIAIVGVFFKDYVEEIFQFENMLLLVGVLLLFTALLLGFTYYAKHNNKEISFKDAFIIGVAQVFAILPGISRSGTTIATGLLLKNKKEEIAKFSFLMVLVPILGENILDLLKKSSVENVEQNISVLPLLLGFIAAFITGLLACKAMIKIVKKGKLIYFAIYCALVGAISIIFS